MRLVGGQDALHEREALGGRGAGITVERSTRSRDGTVHILGAAHGDHARDRLGGGIDDLEFLRYYRIDPGAVNIKLPIVINHYSAPRKIHELLIAILLAGMAGRRSLVASCRRLVAGGGMPRNRRWFYGHSSHSGICIVARLRARNCRERDGNFAPVTPVLECLCLELQDCCSCSPAAAPFG